MDTSRKFAYRQLLYLAMNDIRSISGLVDPPDRLLNPATSGDALTRIARAAEIANWLENLAGFSSGEFDGFDEDRFWQDHARICKSFPDVAAYRDWFERTIPSPTVAQIDLAEALGKGPPPPGNLAVPVFSHGTLAAELYTPRGHDPQKPHERDEVYVVARGSGMFFDGSDRRAVEPGTFIFVAAGQVHRFEEFSSDFAVWVFFYGPRGGEAAG